MRKAGTEAGRDKAWLANANFNLGFAFGGCCPQGKVGKEEGRGKTRPANANFNLGFAFGGCCAQGKVGKEAGKGKASLVKADFNLGFAFGGCCAKNWPRGRQGPSQIGKCQLQLRFCFWGWLCAGLANKQRTWKEKPMLLH